VPASEPLDTPGAVTNTVYAWNFGVAKQVVAVRGENILTTQAAVKKIAALVLFSAPE